MKKVSVTAGDEGGDHRSVGRLSGKEEGGAVGRFPRRTRQSRNKERVTWQYMRSDPKTRDGFAVASLSNGPVK
jgi:hypothetical protein